MSNQLKKTDFLNAVTAEPQELGAITEQLTNDGYEFLPSYVDYLTEHFIEANRIQRNEDGTLQRTASTSSSKASERDVFEVRLVDGEYELVKSVIRGNPNTEQTLDENGNIIGFGWALTANAAVKKASSHVFANYKAESATVKELLDVEATEVNYEDPIVEEYDIEEDDVVVEGDDAL